jgi:hypothetical protein
LYRLMHYYTRRLRYPDDNEIAEPLPVARRNLHSLAQCVMRMTRSLFDGMAWSGRGK